MAQGDRAQLCHTDDGFTMMETLVTLAVLCVILAISSVVITMSLTGASDASATLSAKAVSAFDAKWTTSGFTVINGTGTHTGTVLAFDDVNVNGRYDTDEELVGHVKGRLTRTGTGTLAGTPDQPTNLTWVQTSATSSTLAWTAPNPGDAPLNGYTLTTSSPGTLAISHAGTAHSATITGLQPGQAYWATVTATNAIGPGHASEKARLSSTTTPDTAPTAASLPPASLLVSWQVPGPYGYPITGYTVRYATTADMTTGVRTQAVPATTTTTTLKGLTRGTTYWIQVAATTTAGTSGWSTPVSRTPAGNPGTPDGPTLTVTSPTSLLATWNAPAANGAAITGYAVTYSTSATLTTAIATRTTTGTSLELTALTPGVRYYVAVTAANSVGPGTRSPITSTVPGGKPGAPAAITATLTGVSTATLVWTEPVANGYPITGYTLASTPASGVVITHTGTQRTATVTGLAESTDYWFTVAASNDLGASDYSPASNTVSIRPPTPPALPPAPACAGMTINNAASFTLTWAAPATTNGSPIVSYRIQVATNSAFTTGVMIVDTGTSAVSRKFIPVTPGTTYFARVATTTASGTGAYSACTATGTTWSSPAQVAGVTATRISATTATLAWDALPPVQGTSVISYRITRATNSRMNGNVTTIDTGSTARTATMTGLTAGVTYYYTVAATSHAKTGTASEVVSLKQ